MNFPKIARQTRLWTLLALAGAIAPLISLGCGGGGGGGGGGPRPTSTPRPSATPNLTATPVARNRIVFRLRDTSGALVNGVVTLGSFRLATIDGVATFDGISPGTYTATIEVNGRTQTQRFTSTAGTTTVEVTVSGALTPVPTGTIPPPPV